MKHLFIIIISFLNSFLPAQAWPATPVPLHLAEDAVIAAQKAFPDDKQARYYFMDAYCNAYLDTWRYGSNIVNTTLNYSESSSQQGYITGLKASKEETNRAIISPQDFGYLIKTLEGTYNGHIEKSEFVISGTNERLHLNHGAVESLPEGEFKIEAWVSPEAPLGFGHGNQWKREIIVIKVLDPKEKN